MLLNRVIRGLLKMVAGIAGIVFLLAPLTSEGVALMSGSLVVAALCLIALKVKPEGQRVVLVNSFALREAEGLIAIL